MHELHRRTLLSGLAVFAAGGAAMARTGPAPAWRNEAINGRRTIRSLPRAAAAIVYLFHGSGGSEAFANRLHTRRVIEKLSARGYGFAAAASGDREPPAQWDLRSIEPDRNPDVAYMLGLHRTLTDRGEIDRATPVFTMGMSNGGGFANLFAVAARTRGLTVKGVADYMGPIPAPAREQAALSGGFPPLFVVLGENDGLVSAETVGAVADGLKAAGAQVERHLLREQLVTAETFRDVPGLAGEDRSALVTALVASGVIDAGGRRLIFRDRAKLGRAEMADLGQRMPQGPAARDVLNEVLIAWAGHQMRSDLADPQVRFFDRQLGR